MKSFLPSDLEINDAVNLEMKFVRQFKDWRLEDAIRGETVSNEYGDCYLITNECGSELRQVDYDNLAEFCRNDDLAIIDIETLGLSENPIILLGMANVGKNMICTRQFLLPDISNELAAIWSFVSHIKNGSSLVTYNGENFDIPYIKQRLSHYGVEASLSNPHFDAIHFARSTLWTKTKDYRLGTVEKYFGIQRGMDIPGWMVPHLYNTYLKTRNVGPLVAIVKHNKQDLINLGTVVSRLCELSNARS